VCCAGRHRAASPAASLPCAPLLAQQFCGCTQPAASLTHPAMRCPPVRASYGAPLTGTGATRAPCWPAAGPPGRCGQEEAALGHAPRALLCVRRCVRCCGAGGGGGSWPCLAGSRPCSCWRTYTYIYVRDCGRLLRGLAPTAPRTLATRSPATRRAPPSPVGPAAGAVKGSVWEVTVTHTLAHIDARTHVCTRTHTHTRRRCQGLHGGGDCGHG